uniref:Uroporphyrinogen decarboxylase n=1 Tax=Chloropicon laureae TaxID=464258 RepID=A0A7S2Z6V6_9CHLO|mmetsp:Transcript_7919/g.20356  ORF Transcript_7919/g.20356 Transcript_7919/m.20356 type:complete len:400 (+) Transcript_7919:117-1316(+)
MACNARVVQGGSRGMGSGLEARGGLPLPRGRKSALVHASTSEEAVVGSGGAEDAKTPRLVKAALGQPVDRAPAWMMRQAGRYQKAYRDLSAKYPGFRQRSETTDLIVDITLQPWRSFKPDGLILFSDILTPLNAMGIPFEIDESKGPIIDDPVTQLSDLDKIHAIEFDKVSFVGEALSILRDEVKSAADVPAVLGFVGAPWTLATYVVEGKSTNAYKIIKCLCDSDPGVMHGLLQRLAESIALYCTFQIEAGAQAIQVFDSWGGQLPPAMWDVFSAPYIKHIVDHVKQKHPGVPVTLYANGSGGLLERMKATGADVIGLDWTLDMGDARARLGDGVSVQGNVDPVTLFSTKAGIEAAIDDCIAKAGTTGHVLNLGHGVMVGTPEESVAHFFEYNRSKLY